MKEIILKVPDQKVDFVLELVKQLGLEVESEEIEIPEEHKNIVRERISKSQENPDRLLDWNNVKGGFKVD
ncbi:addiction module protein [Rhodohalobacter sp. 8-1]|uniref:addiction module protein n=1 Tax=Rhodohalobacter sp. 8-1 TaxID=3131972 RepID=UPI0030EC5A15